MVSDLVLLFETVQERTDRAGCMDSIVGSNCLGKPTMTARRKSGQYLAQLYGLDQGIPLYRILRRLWVAAPCNRPVLAMLVALARDPLLAATADVILSLKPQDEYQPASVREAVISESDRNYSESTLRAITTRVSSSWTQAGHLAGRAIRHRRTVDATPESMALALYIGYVLGFRGRPAFESPWMRVLDCNSSRAQALAVEAKRRGLLDLRIAGDVVALDPARLDPKGHSRSHVAN